MSKPTKIQVKKSSTSGTKTPVPNKSVNDNDEDDKPSVRSAIIARLEQRSK